MENKKILAIIPARGGSKRIPRKNVKNFLGKPIISYSIKAALESKLFDEVMVSTDNLKIAKMAVKFGARVPFLRSVKNSGDRATTSNVIKEVLLEYLKRGINFNYVCCLYATAPFVSIEKLIKAKQILVQTKADSVFPIVSFSYPIQRSCKINYKGLLRMNWPEKKDVRSQDLEPTFHDAGQFYFLKVKNFLKNETIFTANSRGIIVSELECQDIDDLVDWKMAEIKYSLLSKKYDFK